MNLKRVLTDSMDVLVRDLQTIFRGIEYTTIKYDEMSQPLPKKGIAATLVVLNYQDGEWQVLLNLRSKHLRRHPGEVCFPGGMREIEDQTLVETALREAYEEIGLPGENVRICTVLKPFMSKWGIPMHPVLALLTKPFVPFCSEEENHTSFYVQERFQLHSFMLEEMVWGLTAWVCIMVSMTVYNQYPEYRIDYIEDRDRPAKDIVIDMVNAGSALLRREKSEDDDEKVPTDVSKSDSKI